MFAKATEVWDVTSVCRHFINAASSFVLMTYSLIHIIGYVSLLNIRKCGFFLYPIMILSVMTASLPTLKSD